MAETRRLAAIMFTDMVGYSAIAQADEALALDLLRRHNELLRPIFARFRGREVKTVGDAFLVEFESALEATQCAIAIQRDLDRVDAVAPEARRIRVRIGIHVGDVVRSDGDLFGDAVNIASRIQPLAEPGGICLSQQVFDQVRNKIAEPLVRLPPTALKHIRVPMVVYRVGRAADAPPGGDGGAAGPTAHHLAVLPLANISPDPHDEYFADGLTEELISVLSHVRDLTVIARTSVTPYKTAPKSIPEVGAELGVDSVLEGSVRKAGNRLRITLQLIDVATQGHIWASSYNREIDDVFAVQTDIAERTAEALRLEFARATPGGPPDRPPTGNLEAYDHYLRGLVAASRLGHAGLREAIDHFEAATRLDPDFAEAYANWANVYVSASGDVLPMTEVMPRARELAARALALDPDSSMAHAVLGNIAFQFDQDWARAESEFQRAIALNGSNTTAYRFYGMMLFALDRIGEGKEALRKAMRLDPAGGGGAGLSYAKMLEGDFDGAVADARAEADSAPESDTLRLNLSFVLSGVGRLPEALELASRPAATASGEIEFDTALARAVAGDPGAARTEIGRIERGETSGYLSKTDLALLYGAAGEADRAIALLEEEYAAGNRVLWLYYRGAWFDGLRHDPRFVALLRRYGVPVDRARGPPRTPKA